MKRVRTSLVFEVALGILTLCGAALADVVGIEISGPNEVAENFRASYKAIAYYDNNGSISTMDVTNLSLWVVEPNTAANIDENGFLTTKYIVKEQSATIMAGYTEGDVTFNAEKIINIFPTCPTGTALQFDGMDDFVQAPTTGLPTGNSDRTLQLWVKLNVIPMGHEAYFAGYGNFGSFNQVYVLGSSGATLFFSQWGDGVTGPSLAPGQWYHVAVTNVGNLATLYLDGTVVGSKSVPIETPAGTQFYIGRIPGSLGDVRRLNGLVDEVSIYNRALSAEEIRANMYKRLAGDEPRLVGYWDFDEGGGQIVYDLSGNGNDGRLGVTAGVDASDPTWVESDAPIGICTPYLIATMAAERAVERKTALIEELLATLVQEWAVYEVLEELLESGDSGDLNKGGIVKAKQKIHSAAQHEEQSIDALEKSLEKLKDALNALGYEPPGQASNPNPANGATGVSTTADLIWTTGSNAVSHNVYFGTSSSPPFIRNQTVTTFVPDSMDTYTTYYWRIDEVNPSGTTAGTVWSFRTAGGGPPPI
jgi:hypothetical protein